MPESYYPSSATLAAFRRSIDPHVGILYNARAAMPHELRNGIGASSRGMAWGVMYPDSTLMGEARAEASRIRSAAFERLDYAPPPAAPGRHRTHSDSPSDGDPSRPGGHCGPLCDLYEDPAPRCV